MVNNSVVDFVSRMKTGLKNNSKFVYVPYSFTVLKIILLLRDQGCFLYSALIKYPLSSNARIKVAINYINGRPVFRKIELISRPGLRVYWSIGELAKRFNRSTFQGFYLISTPKGLLLSSEIFFFYTLKRQLSGEILVKFSL